MTAQAEPFRRLHVERIVTALTNRGMTVAELAQRTGLTEATLVACLSQRRTLDAGGVAAIARVLRFEHPALLTAVEQVPPPDFEQIEDEPAVRALTPEDCVTRRKIAGDDADEAFLQVLPYTVHDGRCIPPTPDPAAPDAVWPADACAAIHRNFVSERDWGARALADTIAHYLRLPEVLHVNLARSVLDFGRLPDLSWSASSTHLDRRAVPWAVARDAVRDPHLAGVLTYYDWIAARWREVLEERLDALDSADERDLAAGRVRGPILLGVHTYDRCDAQGNERPAACLIYRPEPAAGESTLPVDLYDPLFPRQLVDFTADRMLANRLALELERERVPTAHHEVYHLPAGSVEVRTQVWMFFQYLRRVLRRCDDPALRAVGEGCEALWSALLNVNGRDTAALGLRRWLRGTGTGDHDPELRRAYQRIHRFLGENPEVVRSYQVSPFRPSSLALEIRKDMLVGEVDGRPSYTALRGDQVCRLGAILARGIWKYVLRDLGVKGQGQPRWWIVDEGDDGAPA